ncbi:MAG: hypothetical protein CVV06_08390 [Gammaproteobacteria bacterium HGW-Gammaproteobacteria-10]|nr:MAG: hypothetical protein CVV06_08390 [Gammaproteobacteria bacterium HGW-Gammaproteobacteria-10]
MIVGKLKLHEQVTQAGTLVFIHKHGYTYSLYTQRLANFMKVWGVASEDVGSRDRCRQAPMDGFIQPLNSKRFSCWIEFR